MVYTVRANIASLIDVVSVIEFKNSVYTFPKPWLIIIDSSCVSLQTLVVLRRFFLLSESDWKPEGTES